jgi:hypothetical protein
MVETTEYPAARQGMTTASSRASDRGHCSMGTKRPSIGDHRTVDAAARQVTASRQCDQSRGKGTTTGDRSSKDRAALVGDWPWSAAHRTNGARLVPVAVSSGGFAFHRRQGVATWTDNAALNVQREAEGGWSRFPASRLDGHSLSSGCTAMCGPLYEGSL